MRNLLGYIGLVNVLNKKGEIILLEEILFVFGVKNNSWNRVNERQMTDYFY